MDSTDFAIAMVSGVIIIIAIFLFILLKIFEKKKKTRRIMELLPDITKIETNETRPGKFVIKPQEIEGLEKEFQMARDLQKNESVIDMGGQKEDIPSVEPEKTIQHLNDRVQILKKITEETLKETKEEPLKDIKEEPLKDTKEEPLKGSTEPIKEKLLSQSDIQSIEENEKLRLEDILIEIRDENTKRKAKTKITSGKNLEKAEKVENIKEKDREIPKKKQVKKPVRKMSEKSEVPEQVSKAVEEKSPGKKPGKKGNTKKKTRTKANENTGSGEL